MFLSLSRISDKLLLKIESSVKTKVIIGLSGFVYLLLTSVYLHTPKFVPMVLE